MTTTKPINIDEYIAGFPKEVQAILEQVRATVRKAAPDAEEAISYGIPTFKLQKTNLVHFAAFKNHIGFYPTPTGTQATKPINRFAKNLILLVPRMNSWVEKRNTLTFNSQQVYLIFQREFIIHRLSFIIK